MKRAINTTENAPVKATADSITYIGEIANNAGESIRSITAANLARKTHVKYAVLNLEDLTTTTGEMVVDYTRSTDKAEKLVADALRKDGADLSTARIVVTDIFNESAERRVYDTQDLIVHCDKLFKSESEAREFAATLAENWSIRKVAAYVYGACAWVRDELGNNKVEFFTWPGTDRYSGIRTYTDALNQYLEFQHVCDEDAGNVTARWHVIYIEPDSRTRVDSPDYVVITAGNLAKCRYHVIGEKDTTDDSNIESEIIEG